MQSQIYSQLSRAGLNAELHALEAEYEVLKSKSLKLDMSRGVQGNDQLELSLDMLTLLNDSASCRSDSGIDCRNYGLLDGLPEVKAMFGDILGVPAESVIVCGNSSLNIMYDTVARGMLYGVCGNPPQQRGQTKFICPVPGYDRHFGICESLGIEMVCVDMTPDGPDMDAVVKLVADPSFKGIWCVPKFSNPDGIVYSDETVRRLAALRPASPDFRIYWDNAYVVHTLTDENVPLLSIFEEAKACGNEDIVYIFASTSKITFPGSGVAVIAASDHNIRYIKSIMKYQTIGHDKLNQLRHIRFFGNAEGIVRHMRRHAALIKPKFDTVLDTFDRELTPTGIAEWSRPKGGYFISINLPDGTASRVWELMNNIGVKLTPAGSTFPYKHDPRDRNIRIAPTAPTVADLSEAVNAFCVCARLAAVRSLIGQGL